MSKKKKTSGNNNALFRVLTRLTEIIVLYVLSMFFVTQIIPMLASLTFKLAGGAEAVGANIGVLFGAWLAPLLFCVLVSVAAYIGIVVYLHRFVGRMNRRFFPAEADGAYEEQHSTEPMGKAKLGKVDDDDDESDTLEEEFTESKAKPRKSRKKQGARA